MHGGAVIPKSNTSRIPSKAHRELRPNQVFLWPAAPASAPHGIESTGDPRYIAPWTAIGGPMVTIPAGLGGDGLPLGCILCGRPGQDGDIADIAVRLAEICEESALA